MTFAYQKGFSEKVIINIEKDKDCEKIISFYQIKHLFSKKNILIVNFLINKVNSILIKHIQKIIFLLNSDTLTILKFNRLSDIFQKNKLLDQFQDYNNIISCFTPYHVDFFNWVKYEIQEKKINIEKQAFFFLCKHYNGNTLFIYQVLEMLLITWPNTYITKEKIKKIMIDFFDFSPLYWINYIFKGQIEKSIYILNIFFKKKYDPIILIRSLQKDLLKLIYIKREKKISINMLLKKYNIQSIRHEFFINALKKINNDKIFQAIRILVKIEINIKKKHNNYIWNQLQELTFVLYR